LPALSQAHIQHTQEFHTILKYISHVYHFPSPFSVLFHKELLYGSSIFHNICLTCPKQAKYLSLPNEFHSKMGKNKKDFCGMILF